MSWLSKIKKSITDIPGKLVDAGSDKLIGSIFGDDPHLEAFKGLSFALNSGMPGMQGQATRQYLNAVAPEMNIWEKFGQSGGGQTAGVDTTAQQAQVRIAEQQMRNQRDIASIQAKSAENVAEINQNTNRETLDNHLAMQAFQQNHERAQQGRQQQHEVRQQIERLANDKAIAHIRNEPAILKLQAEIPKIEQETAKLRESRNQLFIDQWLSNKIETGEMIARLTANGIAPRTAILHLVGNAGMQIQESLEKLGVKIESDELLGLLTATGGIAALTKRFGKQIRMKLESWLGGLRETLRQKRPTETTETTSTAESSGPSGPGPSAAYRQTLGGK